MAYQVKRKGVYTADLELAETDGTIIHTLRVEIDSDSMAVKLSEKHAALLRALQDINSAEDDAVSFDEKLKVIGRTVTDLLEAVFGVEDAKTVIDFYHERYIEMCHEVLPFITQEVIPQVRKIAQEDRKMVMKSYNRKQRRLFGKV